MPMMNIDIEIDQMNADLVVAKGHRLRKEPGMAAIVKNRSMQTHDRRDALACRLAN